MDHLSIFFIPIYIVATWLEWVSTSKAFPGNYKTKDTVASLSLGVAYLVLAVLSAGLLISIFSFVYQFRFFEMPRTWSALLLPGEHTTWWAFAVMILADDFCFYVFHRVSHVCRFWWCMHETHHSSQHYNYSTALRQPFLEAPTNWIFWLLMPLLGFRAEDILFQMAVSLFYQFWVHTKFTHSFGILDSVFNTPSHHRVHHGRNIRYLDKNYGGIFIFWDRLFGTFAPEIEPVEYGLLHQLDSFNPVYVGLHTFRNLYLDIKKAPGFSAKFKYIFNPPGWRHDGTGKTAVQLQSELGC